MFNSNQICTSGQQTYTSSRMSAHPTLATGQQPRGLRSTAPGISTSSASSSNKAGLRGGSRLLIIDPHRALSSRISVSPQFSQSRRSPCSTPRQVVAVASADVDEEMQKDLDWKARIDSGEFKQSGSFREKCNRPVRKLLAKDKVGPGRSLSLAIARASRRWNASAAAKMPEARGDIRIIVGEPVFVPLHRLFLAFGGLFKLSFGPKSFVVVSDPKLVQDILTKNSGLFSKGLLSEILDFVMGEGLIPADGEVWKTRRRVVVPSLHRKYIESMVGMFGECAENGIVQQMDKAAKSGNPIEMENYFSRLALDIIGKAVFNYDFNSLTTNDPVIQAVYTTLREAEYRSINIVPYWKVPLLRALVPRQRKVTEALTIINDTLNMLISNAKQLVEENDEEFVEEFLSKADPSILYFLIASGDDVNSKRLRDDLMTLLIAGHETTAAVLTWTFHLLATHPEVQEKVQAEVDAVLGDRMPDLQDIKDLRYTTRVINESMRLYPQPPVLIRRALEDVDVGGYPVKAGSDFFISVWNLHRSPELWDGPNEFRPERFPVDEPIPNEQTTDFKYLPFGGGKRKCVGDQFALFESITALAMLMRRFSYAPAPDAPKVGMTTGATIHTSEGLYLTVTARDLAGKEMDGLRTGREGEGAGAGPAAEEMCPHMQAAAAAAAAHANSAPPSANGSAAHGASSNGGGGCPHAAAAAAAKAKQPSVSQ